MLHSTCFFQALRQAQMADLQMIQVRPMSPCCLVMVYNCYGLLWDMDSIFINGLLCGIDSGLLWLIYWHAQ